LIPIYFLSLFAFYETGVKRAFFRIDKTGKRGIITGEEYCPNKRLALFVTNCDKLKLTHQPSLGRVAVFAFLHDNGNRKDTDVKSKSHELHPLSVGVASRLSVMAVLSSSFRGAFSFYTTFRRLST
ncbi:MAG: hypothetical protein NC319_08695, partial [Butyricicoccus sp.]|nr:hypothetical protein [Butyricicoccus sp.]